MPDETTGLPVIIFIHGGGYRYGSAAQYGGETIIREKVIFVPIQYRLGTLGILGDGSKEFGGNVALFDMHAALQWVCEYISFFGGDKKQIKIMGHGSGASSAMFLSQSPMGRSSINGVISMSGTSLDKNSYDIDGKNTTLEIANAHNCPHNNEVELVTCLQSKSVEEIIEKDSKLQIDRLQEQNIIKAMSGLLSFSPNIETENDDRGLPGMIIEKPDESLKKEPKNKIPILIGTVKHETANAIDQNEIIKIFKSTSEFLKKSSETLRISNLVNTTKQVSDKLMTTLKLPSLKDYLTIPDNLSPDKILLKLIETTTDIFFNIPSTLTANLWSKFSNAYFYQFEHIADASIGGRTFLKLLPLVGKKKSKGFVAHGDELSFLFDVCDIYGNPINGTELKTQRDKDARKNFIKLILQFAYLNSTHSQLSLNEQILQTFRAESTSFIRVSDKLNFDTNFRFCQLSMFGVPFEATQKISCEFLSENVQKLPLAKKATDIVTSGGKKLGFV
ncbi:hypothetical protein PVAND_008676 [Polypedilum vanderplanki]|uniref:Carboxylesterase type B domain-containing protein n=1 Tax=Polypedilum vanderplanki TaxID=319348 RepID=A0A9J6CAB7_POLVA|nr:hypothetical protein PVAND_008676 [Polypedilum vanderplanki]